tara:strand:- start:90 stop:380 length:291 start_codon:yes stop_codon:yes gene_type:complete
MKYFMVLIATMMVVGCVSKGPRFHPNARVKGKTTHRQVDKKINHGDALGKRIAEAKKRIQTAVKEGKMTPEEGKEMMDALKKRARKAKPTHKGKAK